MTPAVVLDNITKPMSKGGEAFLQGLPQLLRVPTGTSASLIPSLKINICCVLVVLMSIRLMDGSTAILASWASFDHLGACLQLLPATIYLPCFMACCSDAPFRPALLLPAHVLLQLSRPLSYPRLLCALLSCRSLLMRSVSSGWRGMTQMVQT